MLDIEFKAALGDEDVNVKISNVHGAGNSTLFLFFNKRYQGTISYLDGWKIMFQLENFDYTRAELDTLIEKLT
jgi:hypothetical protein